MIDEEEIQYTVYSGKDPMADEDFSDEEEDDDEDELDDEDEE